MLTIVSQANYKPHPWENTGGPRLVEVGSYIPVKRQVEDMMAAGFRLEAMRAGMYDFEHPNQDDGSSFDPTRAKGYDYSDAYQQGLELSRKLQEQRDAARAAQAAEIEAKALAEQKALEDRIRAQILAETKPPLE